MPSSSIIKSIAITLAATLVLSTALPVAGVSAGQKKYKNGYNGHKYKKQRRNRNSYNPNVGNIIASGIIGLTIGTIIADSTQRRRRRVDELYYEQPYYRPPQPVFTYEEPYYRAPLFTPEELHEPPTPYDYIYPRQEYFGPTPLIREPRPPRKYIRNERSPKVRNQEAPKVITYDEVMSKVGTAEPWTPAWYTYCRAKFRSFNDKSGTFLGYDGKRHFCIPK